MPRLIKYQNWRLATTVGLYLSILGPALADLPAPLPSVCVPVSGPPMGCFNDSFTRTFPVAVSTQPGDAFHDNMTIETCAYLCSTAAPAPYTTVAALEDGVQCFCTNAAGVANATADGLLAPASSCNTPCVGNPLELCGGQWRVQAYAFSCTPYDPQGAPWQNASLSAEERVADLVSRLSPVQLIAQLTQVGVCRFSPCILFCLCLCRTCAGGTCPRTIVFFFRVSAVHLCTSTYNACAERRRRVRPWGPAPPIPRLARVPGRL